MKTDKTIKKKTPTATAKAAPAAVEGNGLETAAIRKTSVKVAAPEPPQAQAITAPATATVSREISTDLIAQRAYVIWEQQGRPHGRDLANWLLAETQLKQELSLAA